MKTLMIVAALLACSTAACFSPTEFPEQDPAPHPAPAVRTCEADETPHWGAGLDLTRYGCEEVQNQAPIPGGRAWCCLTSSGPVPDDTCPVE